MAGITVDVLDREVIARIRQLQQTSVKPAMKVVGQKLTSKIQLGFRASATPWGAPWAPLKFRQGQPLRDTGRMQRSINWRIGGTDAQPHVDVGTKITAPGGASIAAVHQFGATIEPVHAKLLAFMAGGRVIFAKKVVIPARPFMPIRPGGEMELPPTWAADVTRALRAHLNRVSGQ